jgi:hypothetical protein
MSATYGPFGLAPVFHESGIIRPAYPSAPIASAYGTNIFMNSPVQIDGSTPTGNLVLCAAQGAASATPAANTRPIGTFQGVEYTAAATGRRTVANFWSAGTIASGIVAWYTRTSSLTYNIQANGPVTQAMLGNQASFTTNNTGSGNTTTGYSTVGLDLTTLGASGTNYNQCRIVGFDTGIANAPGDAFTIVQVQLATHQDLALAPPY